MDAAPDSTALRLAAASAFLLFAGGFWTIVCLGQWSLAPLDRSRIPGKAPIRFSLREFLLLGLQMQLVVAACLRWHADEPGWPIASAAVGAAGLAACWWYAIRWLSHCGVTCGLRRAVFLALVAPLACAGIGVALWHNGRAVLLLCTGEEWPLLPWLLVNLAILAGFGACRLINVWVVSDMLRTGRVNDVAVACRQVPA